MTRSKKRRGRNRSHPRAKAESAQAPAARVAAVGEQLAFALLLLAQALAFDTGIDRGYALPKLVALHLVAPLVFAFAAYRLWRGAAPIPPRVPVVAAVALGGWWVVVTVAAFHRHTSLYGMPGRYNGLWTQLTCLGLFVVAALAPDRATARRRLLVVVGVLVPVAAFTIFQYFVPDPRWPAPRPPATIGQPVLLSALLALALPLTLAATFARRSRTHTVTSALATALLAAAIAASLSRGPLVGALVAAVVVLAAATPTRRSRLVAIGIGLVLLTAAGSMVLLNPQRREGIAVRLRAFTQPGGDPSVSGRLVFYDAALRMAGDHPLTGVGLESFGLLYPRYRPVEPEAIPVDNIPSMVHNGYLQWAVTAGLPGLLLYLVVLGSVGTVVVRSYRRTSEHRERLTLAALLGALSGYAIQDLSGWLDAPLSVFFWTLLGTALALSRDDPPGEGTPASGGARLSLAALGSALLVVVAFVASAFPIPRILAEARAARTLGSIHSASPAALKAVVTELPDDAFHLERVGNELVRRFVVRPTRREYLAAADLLDRSARSNPFNPYASIQRIHLETVAAAGPPELRPLLGVEDHVAALVSTDPNNPTAHLAIARLRYREGRLDEAQKEVERALQLRPGLGAALVVQGDLQHEAGETREAAASYDEAVAQLEPSNPLWSDAMLKLAVNQLESGQVDHAVSVAEALVRQKPDAAMGHLVLGVGYGMKGDVARARAAYETTLVLDPENEEARKALAALDEG